MLNSTIYKLFHSQVFSRRLDVYVMYDVNMKLPHNSTKQNISIDIRNKTFFYFKYIFLHLTAFICSPYFLFYKSVYSCFPGRVIISGAEDGLIAISSPTTGMTVRMLSDHKGAPITDIHASFHKVSFSIVLNIYFTIEILQLLAFLVSHSNR